MNKFTQTYVAKLASLSAMGTMGDVLSKGVQSVGAGVKNMFAPPAAGAPPSGPAMPASMPFTPPPAPAPAAPAPAPVGGAGPVMPASMPFTPPAPRPAAAPAGPGVFGDNGPAHRLFSAVGLAKYPATNPGATVGGAGPAMPASMPFTPPAAAAPAPQVAAAPAPTPAAPPSVPSTPPSRTAQVTAPAAAAKPVPPSKPGEGASQAYWNALFRKYHGSAFDPNSSMDKAKLQALQQARSGGGSLLAAANRR